ncbi:MAG TPA: DNA polymerase/3'-5' exonuclease PolX [Candidatus Heimdallarchaeota archaeon]|nr:DNA polymerase/3'-5' exonuclease PolX [Candidatus Heimdallarchaeota archaeon]
MKNRQVARILYEIAELLDLEGVQFKPRAYRRAAQAVESCSAPIEELAAEGKLSELPGVGQAIARKIEEIVQTGRLTYHEELKVKLPVDLFALTQVDGVGPKTAKLLYEELEVRSLDDLEAAAREGKIRGIKGLGEKTEGKILRGLAEARGVERRELLGYALPLARGLCNRLMETGLFARLEPAGSLRRGQETIGDLDILAVSGKPEEAARAFVLLPDVEEILAQGAKKSSVRLSGGFQVDLRIVPEESFGSALQYFTGSKSHNIRLRERAVAQGYKLNEYGLFDKREKRLAGESEEGIYEALELAYIPAELREDEGEIFAAERGTLPDLVTAQQIRCDLHVHTDWSDGKASLAEMVEAARARGLAAIAITDHYRFSQVIGGLSADDLRRQIDEIARMNTELSELRLLAGVEANIARDGSIDVPNRLLKLLDFVIVAVHSHFRLSRDEMTERLIKAVETEGVHLLAHPTGRKIGERPAYEADWAAVFERAARADTALEINANPIRLDLRAVHVRQAIDAGAKLAIGTDAHVPEHFDFAEFGLLTARRGWAEAKDVLNTLPADALLKGLA